MGISFRESFIDERATANKSTIPEHRMGARVFLPIFHYAMHCADNEEPAA
jgi:hypothetical protein